MKSNIIKSIIIAIAIIFHSSSLFSQLTVSSDGSLFVDSYVGNFGHANWTKVHSQIACAYHLYNTYYARDMFYVRGDGYGVAVNGFFTTSDSTLKTNIKDINSALSKVRNLHGVTYNRKFTVHPDSMTMKEEIGPNQYGLIAQEVQKIVPDAVIMLEDSILAVNYSSLIPILIESIKEQQIQIETLQNSVNFNDKEIKFLKSQIESYKNSSNSNLYKEINNSFSNSESILYQNIPNPFNENTKINYFLSESTKNAKINIYSMNGILLKSIDIDNFGNGSINIEGNEFNAGIYSYILIADGKPIDTKQMILTK